jgi:DNA helicase-2/ATP-dependent DNA helicase PcrA
MTLSFFPRPSQRQILKYRRGRLGISAVPGSGKTHTLSALAAQIIARGDLEPEQEVLIITLVNSAVDNFAARIGGFVRAKGLIPQLGYRVRTLHGLAHDIVREDPPLVNLDKQFSIVDEASTSSMIREAARAWVHLHPELQAGYVASGLDDYQRRKVAAKDWPETMELLAAAFVRSAKDRRLTAERLKALADRQPTSLPLLEMGLQVYADYQRALIYRGAVDFDDLIRLAADMLDASPELLERLRYRWPFILEDEAQDSSKLQQTIISTLAGDDGNWVRVGDPNQAIFETFTTADPRLLRIFIDSNPHADMPESGRCQASVMQLANFLVEWTMHQHPVPQVRDALAPPLIRAAPAGDPQPNPPDDPEGIVILPTRFTPEEEIDQVVKSIAEWLPHHGSETVAVLSSTNDHAARVAEALKRRGIEYRELLRSTSSTRAAAGALSYILSYLASPDSASKLAQVYQVWRRDWRGDGQRESLYHQVATAVRRLKQLEEYLTPRTPPEALTRGKSGQFAAEALATTASDAAQVDAE